MKASIIFFISIALSILIGINYYIGLRGRQAFNSVPYFNTLLYWIVFWALALSYFVARLTSSFLPEIIINKLNLIGSYWLAAMMYFIMILIVIDIIRLIDRFTGFIPVVVKQNKWTLPVIGITAFLVVIGILIYGTWNAKNPRVNYYSLSIPKPAGSLEKLHVVMVSDTHLGEIVDNSRLINMVNIINKLQPDIVLLGGDEFDDNIGPFMKQKMSETLLMLKSRLGIYAILGNHDYFGDIDNTVMHLKEAGIQVLRDNYIKINDSFYIVGRDDSSVARMIGKPRAALSDIMNNIDKSLPVILLDHQPTALKEAQEQGADLLLSGHTHRGQLFPSQFITERIYEVDFGYLKKGDMQVIVSSGFGTWGPPIRTGNTPEIVDITINFTGSK